MQCRTTSYQRFPNRILEIKDDKVYLRSNIATQASARYACLSHCWGLKGSPIQLTSASEDLLHEGVMLKQLPKTFKDAAEVCLKLGISYLWIDALCIYQDSAADWEHAAATMADIYEGALITIAAVCASDSHQGLYPLRNDFEPRPLKTTNLHIRNYVRENTDEAAVFDKLISPLLTRAWVYQERRISSRVLYFSAYQLVYECKTGRWTENEVYSQLWDYVSGEDNSSLRVFGTDLYDPIQAWHHTVSRYSRLQLTFEKDRLPAIAALAHRMMQIRKKDIYLAGLWKSSLLEDLCWQVRTTDPRQVTDRHLPTWSWATHRGSVRYPRTRIQKMEQAEIVDLKYTLLGPPQLGDVENAVIMLRAPVLHLRPDLDEGNGWQRPLMPQISSHLLEKLEILIQGDQSLTDAVGLERGDPPRDEETLRACILCRDLGVDKIHERQGITLHGIVLRKADGERWTRFGSIGIRSANSAYTERNIGLEPTAIESFCKGLSIGEFCIM